MGLKFIGDMNSMQRSAQGFCFECGRGGGVAKKYLFTRGINKRMNKKKFTSLESCLSVLNKLLTSRKNISGGGGAKRVIPLDTALALKASPVYLSASE